MHMKVCTKCKIEKELTEFSRDKHKKDGFYNQCKECKKIYREEYNKINYDRLKEFKEQYLKNYYETNKKIILEKQKIYYEKNKDKTKLRDKEYRLKNKDKINKQKINKKSTNPLFKLRTNVSNLIYISLKKQGYSKKSKTYQILKCTFEEFKIHLEKQFTEGMSWSNMGKWHLDHIYPVSLAKDEEELIKLNHYTNFQPLWAIDNIRKSNKI
jgi:hypothetical protein